MKQRKLGDSEVELSEISLGTWGLASDAYGRSDPKRFREVVDKALELGITTFDLAPLWGDGTAEEVVGEAVKEKREEVQLVTRAGARWNGSALDLDTSPEAIEKDCERSLERLGAETIDLWLLHEPKDELWLRDDWREVVEKLKKEGKIRAWGATASTADSARMAVSGGADAICITYNMIASDDLHDLSGEISKANCGVLARSPLMHGLLAGRWAEYRSFPRTDHRRDRWSSQALRARIRQIDKLRFLVHGNVASLAEAALRYVLANSLVTSAVVGARTQAQVESAVAASVEEPPYLPDDDLVKIPQVLAAAKV
jgi:aryl-alcohol dehydrogenase-like predicted oxidoreductase